MSNIPDSQSLGEVLSERHEEFRALETQLRFNGVKHFNLISASDPIIIEGTILDDTYGVRHFRFYARGDSCNILIGSELGVIREDCFCERLRRWDWPEAGWLSPTEVEETMLELLNMY